MGDIDISLEKIDAFVFDFDGVLTNNLVHMDQQGHEWVSCNRADGLAFDVLRKLNKPAYILSSEKNPVVAARGNKLKIPVLQGLDNKSNSLKELADREGFELQKILYVGNDLNDYKIMQLCGYTACPIDSHERIKSIAQVVLNTEGGNGVVRELLEEVLNIDIIKILYS